MTEVVKLPVVRQIGLYDDPNNVIGNIALPEDFVEKMTDDFVSGKLYDVGFFVNGLPKNPKLRCVSLFDPTDAPWMDISYKIRYDITTFKGDVVRDSETLTMGFDEARKLTKRWVDQPEVFSNVRLIEVRERDVRILKEEIDE